MIARARSKKPGRKKAASSWRTEDGTLRLRARRVARRKKGTGDLKRMKKEERGNSHDFSEKSA